MNFNEALGNMVHDVAAGGAIRHLADLGHSISMIEAELDWPTSREKIAKTIFDYYVEKGIISPEDPKEKPKEHYHYEKAGSTPWKQDMIRVRDPMPQEDLEYIQVDFGKQIYKDGEKFKAELLQAGLSQGDMEYLLELPWPLRPVWHRLDDRMKRIQSKLNCFYKNI